MPAVPFEWIDPQEFAAMEDALTAAVASHGTRTSQLAASFTDADQNHRHRHSQIARECAESPPFPSVSSSFHPPVDSPVPPPAFTQPLPSFATQIAIAKLARDGSSSLQRLPACSARSTASSLPVTELPRSSEEGDVTQATAGRRRDSCTPAGIRVECTSHVYPAVNLPVAPPSSAAFGHDNLLPMSEGRIFGQITSESRHQRMDAAFSASELPPKLPYRMLDDARRRNSVSSCVVTDSSSISKGGLVKGETAENWVGCGTADVAREWTSFPSATVNSPLTPSSRICDDACERSTVPSHAVTDLTWSSEAGLFIQPQSHISSQSIMVYGTTDIAREHMENVSSPPQRFSFSTFDNAREKSTMPPHAVTDLPQSSEGGALNRGTLEGRRENQCQILCRNISVARECTDSEFFSLKLPEALSSWKPDDARRSNQNPFSDALGRVDEPADFPCEMRNDEKHKSEEFRLDNQTPPWSIVRFQCRKAGCTKRKLPSLQFKGQIIYSNTVSDAEANSLKLLQIIEARRALQDGPVPVGFDTEWKVVYKRGEAPRKVAVLQLCVDANQCDVFHIMHSGIPCHLQSLLEDPSIHKTGIGAYGDAMKLHRDYGINVKGIVDLCSLANHKLRRSSGSCCVSRNWSLSALTEELTCKQVEKVPSIRTGNWEACPLSGPQLQYAATDAFASLHLYQVLMTFQDPLMETMEEDTCEVA